MKKKVKDWKWVGWDEFSQRVMKSDSLESLVFEQEGRLSFTDHWGEKLKCVLGFSPKKECDWLADNGRPVAGEPLDWRVERMERRITELEYEVKFLREKQDGK